MAPRKFVMLTLVLVCAGCTAGVQSDDALGSDAALAATATLPPLPTLLRDVQLVNTNNQFTRPYLPPFRKTADGRVGLNLKGTLSSFYLFAPEKLDGPNLQHTPDGSSILASTTPVNVAWAGFEQAVAAPSDVTITHQTICDPSSPLALPGAANAQPSVCADGSGDDCYQLTVISGLQVKGQTGITLTSTPVLARVHQPKTPSASLASVTVLAGGSKHHLDIPDFLEPMVTGDGRLMVFRTTGASLPQSGTTPYNIVYSQLRAGTAACDVSGFASVYPITHAPHDDNLKAAGYGFAQQPFRDAEGNPIDDNVEMGGTYPWIDREGRNLFFTSVSSTLYYADPTKKNAVQSRYPAICIPGSVCDGTPSSSELAQIDEPSDTRGVTVMGLWTHGKMVLVDSVLNNTDFGLGRTAKRQRSVQLYAPRGSNTGNGVLAGWIPLGMGRDNSGGPPGSSTNSTFLDSQENQFNFRSQLLPTSPRDVVWTMASGKGQDELVFDDYLSSNVFIYSEMQPSLSYDSGGIPGFAHFHDGFNQTGHGRGTGFREAPHLQNAATTTRFQVPAYGLVSGARTEPVAMGGVTGRGLWLTGAAQVSYATPVGQDALINANPWSVGLFVDPRFDDDGQVRTLLSFGDGSRVALRGLSAVVFTEGDGRTQRVFALSTPLPHNAWSHLLLSATASTRGPQEVTLFRNGFPVTTLSLAHASLRPLGTGVVLGNGFRGWVDELKVLAARPPPELACNHAHGTLLRGAVAGAAVYPAVQSQLRDPSGTTYKCWVDYTQDHGVAIAEAPAHTQSIRMALLFSEGPLVFNSPRPDSTQNTFCLTCHSDSFSAGLRMEALAAGTVWERNDARRQPFQPPRAVQGNVPAGFLPGMAESNRGAWLDPTLYP